MTTLLNSICLAPKDVFSALKSLQQVASRLRERQDARAVFPDVYGIITRRVSEAIEQGSLFLEPGWIARLAGLFAERYFESLVASIDGTLQTSTAWRLAYACAEQGFTLPGQDALLGINAHINFDLAQGIYDNIVGHGAQDDPELLARYRHDHDAVNQILEEALPECLAVLVARYGCPLTRAVVRVPAVQGMLTRVVMAVLKRWRDQVWDDVLEMLAAQDAEARQEILERMDRNSGRIALLIGLGPLLWGAVSARIQALRAARLPSPPRRALSAASTLQQLA